MPQRTILVVDDEPDDLAHMRQALEAEGYLVLTAAAAADALRVFDGSRKSIDLLVTDVALPGENGCELAKAALERQPELRVLLVSGHAGSSVCEFYGLKSSDLFFLRKPFSQAALITRVREVLTSSQPFPGFEARRTA